MFRAIVQNSFLAVQDVEETSFRRRAKSAEPSAQIEQVGRVGGDDSVQLQLERLGSLMNRGLSSSMPLERRNTAKLQDAPSKMLNGKLLSKVDSNNSVSTMAPDDASDCDDDVGALTSNSLGLRCFPSSGSLFSMISETDEDVSLAGGEMCAGATLPQAPVKTHGLHRTSDDFSHCHVPRHVNFAEEFAAKSVHSGPPTTLMIRNIPNRYTQQQIMRELEMLGFTGTFDFFYAPTDKCTKCTVGYAFVNFLEHESAARCLQVMQTHWFKSHGRQRGKQAKVSVAHNQGLEANIRHYKNAAVNTKTGDGQRGPVIMPSLARAFAAF